MSRYLFWGHAPRQITFYRATEKVPELDTELALTVAQYYGCQLVADSKTFTIGPAFKVHVWTAQYIGAEANAAQIAKDPAVEGYCDLDRACQLIAFSKLKEHLLANGCEFDVLFDEIGRAMENWPIEDCVRHPEMVCDEMRKAKGMRDHRRSGRDRTRAEALAAEALWIENNIL